MDIYAYLESIGLPKDSSMIESLVTSFKKLEKENQAKRGVPNVDSEAYFKAATADTPSDSKKTVNKAAAK